MTRLRCAILDDYLNLSLKLADWSKVEDRVEVTVFKEPFASREAAATALKDFAIICAMRERTPFPRAMFDSLPNLKLLITSGLRNNSIDMAAAKDKQVAVCGTHWPRDPTAPLTMGLILELTRNIGRESVRDERYRLEPEPDRRTMQGSGRHLRHQGRAVLDRRHHHDPRGAERSLARLGGRRRSRADEADQLYRQHRARADHRRNGAAQNAAGSQDRRRRRRRVLGRAAAGRPSVPQARQSRADAASWLRHAGDLHCPL